MKPFGGMIQQGPHQLAMPAVSGMTLRGWWSFGKAWYSGVTTDAGSGEVRLASFDPPFPASPQPQLIQATDARRPRFYDKSIKSQIVPHTELGRDVILECWDADVAGIADVELCGYTMMGVWNYEGGTSKCPAWWWDGLGLEQPLLSSGANMIARRWKSGVGYSDKVICAASEFTGAIAWCVIRYGTGSGPFQETWIGNDYKGAINHSAIGAFTGSAFLIGNGGTSEEYHWGELIVWEGFPSLDGVSDPYRRFNSLSRIYSSMRARWGI